MSSWVLDASALLALIRREPGADIVIRAVAEGAVISAVNLCEVVSKLIDLGMDDASIDETLGALSFERHDFTADAGLAAGYLRRTTAAAGLSLGDRACLELGVSLGLKALTADRTWTRVIPAQVVLIR